MRHPIQHVWITGASDGLGKALACEYATRGISLVLSARNKDNLTAVAQQCMAKGAPQVEVATMDYNDPEHCEILGRRYARRIDSAILCAGVSQRARAIDTTRETLEYIFRVDAITPAVLTQTLLSQWVARGYGQLAFISSIASHAPVPLRSAYCASKAALELHATTTYNEIVTMRSDIDIVCVIPGFINTAISEKALTGSSDTWQKKDANQAKGIAADDAARHIVKKLEKRRTPKKVYVGMNATLYTLALLSKYAPSLANYILARSKTA